MPRIKDDARKVASYSDELNTDKVRILRALFKGYELSTAQLKDAVGIGATNQYSPQWLRSIWELDAEGYLCVSTSEEVRGHTYYITNAGRHLLRNAEAAYAKVKLQKEMQDNE